MVLKHINLTIPPGETLAVMGATGCGKSSLVNLIPRFYDVTQGSVLVDDVDVREYNLKALRQKISVALQKAELFHQTIIVAQRIASARQADRIVVLENGSVAACGSHAELLRDCPVYRDIYDSQMGKEDRHG